MDLISCICVMTVASQAVFIVVPWIYKHILAPYLILRPNFKKYGEWAVITGATEGIGKEFCLQLAAKGLNICLISRTKRKLLAVAAEIETKYGVKTEIIDVDFTDGLEIYEKIESKIAVLDVGILVNNIGMFTEGFYHFHELAERQNYMKDLIGCNVISVLFMTQIVLKQMLKNNRGLVLNLSSISALMPFPISLYSASKAFTTKLTENLALEYKNTGVDFQCIHPGPVLTTVWTMDGGKIMKPPAQVFVKHALKSIGAGTLIIGYLPHVFMNLLSHFGTLVAPAIQRRIVINNFKKGVDGIQKS